jgi:hypothetical protein
MTLTFHQWPWIKVMIKVMTLSWVQCNNSVKYYCNSWTQWKVMAQTMSKTTIGIVTLTFDHTSRLWHFLGSSITILWNIIPIHTFSENWRPGQCLNHYEHCALDLWTITLNQDNHIFFDPGQQSCEILFKSIKKIRRYGPDKLFACHNHYVYSYLEPLTSDLGSRSWHFQCNNSMNPWFQWKLMAKTMFKTWWT